MGVRTVSRFLAIAVLSQSLVGCFAFGGGYRESARADRQSRRSGVVEAIGAGLALAGAIVEVAAEARRQDYCKQWLRTGASVPTALDAWSPAQNHPGREPVWIAGSSAPTDAIRTETVIVRAGDLRSDTPFEIRDQVTSLARARGAIALDEVFYTPAADFGGPKVRMLVTTDEGPYVRVQVVERPVPGVRTITHYDASVEYSPTCGATRATYRPRRESYPEVRTATVTSVTAEQTAPDSLAWAELPRVAADAFRGAGDVSVRLWFPAASGEPR
jgi:hypothetical protein